MKSREEKAEARRKAVREFAHNTRHMSTFAIFIWFGLGPGAAYFVWFAYVSAFILELFPYATLVFIDLLLTCWIFPVIAAHLTCMGIAMCLVRLAGGSPYQPPGQKTVGPSSPNNPSNQRR